MGNYAKFSLSWICLVLFSVSALANLKKEKVLSIALNSEFETLNPLVNTMFAGVFVTDAAIRPLTARDIDGKPKAILIKEIPTLENKKAELIPKKGKAPGLRAEIEFLPEAQWGDGTPLTCRDLQATWKIALSENVSMPNREPYRNLEEVRIDAKDPKKCVLIYKEARWTFFLNFPRVMPAHLEWKVFEKYKNRPQAYERNSTYVRNPTHPGLYNGPYRVSEIKNGSHVTLVPNEKYFGTPAKIPKLIYKFIVNTSTLEANLRSGTVNMISTTGMSLDQAFAFEKKAKAENLPFKTHMVESLNYSHIDLNLDHPILSDVRVRRALAHGLNRDEIMQAFFHGRQKTAHHFSSRFDSWYSDNPKDFTIYDFSLRKAARLLDEAGWKMGPDGFRYKDGKKLTLTISGPADNRMSETLQVYLQESWKKLGMELLVKNYPSRVYFPEIVKKRKYDLAWYSFVDEPDQDQRFNLHSSMIPNEKNAWSGRNRPGWKNKDVDRWLDQVQTEFDSKKRIDLMRKVMRAYTEELPALPIYFKANTAVVPKELKNYRPSGHVYSEFLEVENWSLE